jgi:hypothetical protein
MPRSAREYLQHILDEALYLLERSRGVSNEIPLRAWHVERILENEIIGE